VTLHPWFGSERVPMPAGTGPGHVKAVVLHHLRQIGFREDSVAAQPLMVPRASAGELYGAAARLLALLRRAVLASGRTREERMAALGVGEWLHPLFVDDDLFEERYCACMARPDVIVGPEGPRFLEFNVGGAIGAVVHTALLTRAWRDVHGRGGRVPFSSPDPFAVRADLFQSVAAELGLERGVAVLGTVRDVLGGTGTRYFDVEVEHLRGRGFAAEFFEPGDLPAAIDASGRFRYPLGLRHFTVVEWRSHGIDLGLVRQAMDAGCRFLAPQTAFLISNKKVLGWASEGRPWMTAADRELVRRYLPWTRVVRDGPVEWRGHRHDCAELLLAQREQFVLKTAFGMAGDGVMLGVETERARWAAAVESAVRNEDRVAQEYVEPGRCEIELTDGSASGTRLAEVAPCLGPYVFDGRPAGCLVRYFADGRAGVVSLYGTGALGNVLVTA
jgi:hypothetical protein